MRTGPSQAEDFWHGQLVRTPSMGTTGQQRSTHTWRSRRGRARKQGRRERQHVSPTGAQWILDHPDTAAWVDRDPAPVSGLPGRSA
jgi:hypothetical protein